MIFNKLRIIEALSYAFLYFGSISFWLSIGFI